jgi:nucleotide-binding universal stress UspA family protein
MTTTSITFDPPNAAVEVAEPDVLSPAQDIERNPLRRGPILVALHGRESSNAAVFAAEQISQRLGLELRVVGVVGPEMRYAAPLDIMPDPRTRSREADAAQEQLLRRALHKSTGRDVGWKIELRHGHPASEIARAAEAIDATMIIVDAAPRHGIRHTVAGARALDILRRSRCPVLSVSAPFAALAGSIVAAIDFSPASIRAAQAALLLAADNATLTLVHFPMPLYPERPYRDRTGALIGADVAKAFERLRAEFLPYSPPGLVMQMRVLQGSIVSGIVAQVESLHADVIAVGTHGPKRIERLFVGSSAASLLHLAPCAVLASPAPSAVEWARLELRISDTTVIEDPKDWREILASVTTRNRGRGVSLDIDDPESRAHAQAQGYVLREISYDPIDCCVELRLADSPDGHGCLTREIAHPTSISISNTPEGRDRGIAIAHGSGHTAILFGD